MFEARRRRSNGDVVAVSPLSGAADGGRAGDRRLRMTRRAGKPMIAYASSSESSSATMISGAAATTFGMLT